MTTAGGVLAYSVTVRNAKFQLETFPVGSTPPAWARQKITNPKAWEQAQAPDEASDEEAPAQVADETPSDPDSEPEGALPEPPKGGAGATKKAWVAYATAKGVAFPADASRDDIIAAVEAAE